MSQAVADETQQRCDDSDSDNYATLLVDPLTKHEPSTYDPSLRLSSSLGHLQLECVPEHLTELEEELSLIHI